MLLEKSMAIWRKKRAAVWPTVLLMLIMIAPSGSIWDWRLTWPSQDKRLISEVLELWFHKIRSALKLT